jgi:hydroxypyruvate reductase
MRASLREIFQRALDECSMERIFARHFEYSRGVLRICEDLYALDDFARVHVVALGKAAYSMVEALVERTGARLTGIAAGPGEAQRQISGFRYFAGGHPTPNEESMRAADAILGSLQSLPANCLVLFMISGGGSSIVERPIDDEISLEDLIATYRTLVHSGAPITEMNAIRKHLSAVKGGRMALAANGARQVSVLVSDVPETALDALASGPTMPDTSTTGDCYRIAQKHAMVEQFPASVRELFERHALEETPKSDDPVFTNARWWTVSSSELAARAAAAKAADLGFAVEFYNSCDVLEYTRAADHLLSRLEAMRRGVSRACLISGGEVTVKVTGESGVGGRNQQFALYCAEKIAGKNVAVLSAGTDGIDGNSPASGGVVDGTTLERLRTSGLDASSALARFDAYPLFQSIGDDIMTGPTGNNVRDLRILISWE